MIRSLLRAHRPSRASTTTPSVTLAGTIAAVAPTGPSAAVALAVTISLLAGCVLAGCGGSTQTVSVAERPTTTTPTGATGAGTTGAGTAASGSTGATGTAGAQGGTGSSGGKASDGTPAATTRTASAPAFVEHERSAAGGGTSGGNSGRGDGGGSSAGELSAALALVRAHGYTPEAASDYHPDQTLRVLVGAAAHGGEGHEQQAFFFLDGRYLGTDASSPSGQVAVVAQGDTEVTLAYGLYRPADSLCCPGAGQARVRFQLNDGRLVALNPLPSVSSGDASSRR